MCFLKERRNLNLVFFFLKKKSVNGYDFINRNKRLEGSEKIYLFLFRIKKNK
jgi:hypothetical protein